LNPSPAIQDDVQQLMAAAAATAATADDRDEGMVAIDSFQDPHYQLVSLLPVLTRLFDQFIQVIYSAE